MPTQKALIFAAAALAASTGGAVLLARSAVLALEERALAQVTETDVMVKTPDALPMSTDDAVNTTTPMMNMIRCPTMSPSRPDVISSTASTSA